MIKSGHDTYLRLFVVDGHEPVPAATAFVGPCLTMDAVGPPAEADTDNGAIPCIVTFIVAGERKMSMPLNSSDLHITSSIPTSIRKRTVMIR